MSDDLISRSALVKEINEYMENVYGCDIESASVFQEENESKESYIVQGLLEAYALIGNLPIAYDVNRALDAVTRDCFAMGLDESQVAIIADDVKECMEEQTYEV